ncbi:transposable element Tcb1 transposase [Trichonephila clavipes]|nr:transposable element Tcb1 transposase [Trichonephila clavipes]
MHRRTDPAPDIMVWGDIGYPSVTNLYGTFPLIFLGVFLGNINSPLFPINSKQMNGIRKIDKRIPGYYLNSQRYISKVLEPVVLQGLATAIFQQDNVRLHVVRIVQRFFVNHQIELFPWPARSPDLSPIENMWWSIVAQRLTQITPSAATLDQLWQHVEAAWSVVPQEHIQSLFESMPRRVAVVISNNGGYSGYSFWQEPHFTEVSYDTWSTCYLENKFCCANFYLSFVLHLRWPVV